MFIISSDVNALILSGCVVRSNVKRYYSNEVSDKIVFLQFIYFYSNAKKEKVTDLLIIKADAVLRQVMASKYF